MRDFRKFCRPKTTKSPQIGDVEIQLKCGSIVYVKYREFLKRRNFFKIKSFIGEDPNLPGNILVQDKEINKKAVFSTEDYDLIEGQFEILSIIGSKQDSLNSYEYTDTNSGEAQEGDIILHNSDLNIDSVFSYNDWIELNGSWTFKEIYGIDIKTKTTAAVGDIVIKAEDIITFIKSSDWSKVSNNWEAIGIVCIESRNTPDQKVRILSLDYMDYNNPTSGNSGTGVYMYWGASGNISGVTNRNEIPCMSTSSDTQLTSSVQRAVDYTRIPTDYFGVESSAVTGYKYNTITDGRYCPSMYLEDGTLNPDAIATVKTIPGTSTEFTINNANIDFDGAGNTQKIMQLCTVNTPTNSYNSGNYPSAQCCSLYSKGGLSWYLPAAGELACIVANFSKLNSSRTAVGFVNYDYSNYWFWSSTPHNSSRARTVYGTSGECSSNARSGSSTIYRVLALSAF